MKLFLSLIFSSFIFLGFAQLDSASIISVNNVVINSTDSLGNVYQDTVLQVEIYVNDFDFFGEIVATVIHQSSQYPLLLVKKKKAEIVSSGLYNTTSRIITIQLPLNGENGPLEIRVVVRNYQGASLPFLDTIYTN